MACAAGTCCNSRARQAAACSTRASWTRSWRRRCRRTLPPTATRPTWRRSSSAASRCGESSLRRSSWGACRPPASPMTRAVRPSRTSSSARGTTSTASSSTASSWWPLIMPRFWSFVMARWGCREAHVGVCIRPSAPCDFTISNNLVVGFQVAFWLRCVIAYWSLITWFPVHRVWVMYNS